MSERIVPFPPFPIYCVAGARFVLLVLEEVAKCRYRDVSEPRRGGPSLNTGRSTVLAIAWTQPFEVSKAKGFQGMVDASPLSIAFAKQGVRINTRGGEHGDGNDKNGGDDDDDDAD